MLIPLTRKTLESLLPAVATGPQYAYYWGKPPDFLRRLLISVVGVFAVLIIGLFFEHGFELIRLLVGITFGLYWLWGPVLWASLRNSELRKYQYGGFWQGRVTDVFITEELIGQEETVNNRGDLVIVENRERRLNLEVGDETGFSSQIQVPLKRNHQAIAVGDVAQMLVFSHRGDLGRIAATSDVYIANHNLWVSDYPYVQREAFIEVGRRLRSRLQEEAQEGRSRRRSQRYSEEPATPRRALMEGRPSSRRSSSRRPPREDW